MFSTQVFYVLPNEALISFIFDKICEIERNWCFGNGAVQITYSVENFHYQHFDFFLMKSKVFYNANRTNLYFINFKFAFYKY